MADIPALLAAYYADADPSRLPVIADAVEETGNQAPTAPIGINLVLSQSDWLRGWEIRAWLSDWWEARLFSPGADRDQRFAGALLQPSGSTDGPQYSGRMLRAAVQNRFPIVERIICQFGCVLCQKWHDEDDGAIFWQHIHRHGKHQGPCDKVCKGVWVWKNEPYWTRDPNRKATAKATP